MGSVWHAWDEVLDRDVAIKEVLVHPGLEDAEREVLQERTKREARATARLSHPGVVTVYDVVEEDGRPWIIMELIRASSLDQLIKQDGPLPWRRTAEIGRQVLDALHAAHEAGILHRDVKPSNVLLAAGDRAVLTDFGIATSAGDATLTSTGLVMGSPSYVAPERARGRPSGPASDLWSLGVTLYAMVDGRSPFERSEPMASLMAIISDDPQWTASAGRLWPVIKGLLDKDPDQRLTAHQARLKFDELLSEEAMGTEVTRPVPVPVPLPAEPTVADSPVWFADDQGKPAGLPATGLSATGLPATGLPATTAAQGLGASTVRSPGRPGRTPLLWAAAVLVAVLSVVGLAIALDLPHSARKPASAPVPAASSASGPAAPTPSASVTSKKPSTSATPKPSTTVPDGFRNYKDSTGYSIAVPTNWTGPQRKNGGDFFYSPDHRSYVQVGQTSHPDPSALKDWQDQESSVAKTFAGYHRVRLGPVGQGAPVADNSGAKAADWEYTWQSTSGRKHVLNRGFVLNGHGYAILISAPDGEWQKTRTELAPVFEHFLPGPKP